MLGSLGSVFRLPPDFRPLWLFLAGMLQCCIMTSNDGDLRETPMAFRP